MAASDQLRRLVAEHGDYLLKMAYQLTHDGPAAQDLVQDSLLAVVEADRRRDLTVIHPLAYVLTTMTRRFLRIRATERSTVPIDAARLEQVADSRSDVAHTAAERHSIWLALDELSKPQRAVLVLRYLADLSDERIAAILDCPTSTVRSHASRGLTAIRRRLPDPSPARTPLEIQE